MVETTLPDGLETSGQRVYRKFWHIFGRFRVFLFWIIFFRFQFCFGFLCIFGSPYCGIGATILIGQEI